MSHWFDRLASWSAEGSDDDEERRLTRRQVVRTAATGAGVAGLIGGPLAGQAWGLFGGNSAQCRCWDKAGRINDSANQGLIDAFGKEALFIPGVAMILLGGVIGTSAAYLGQVVHCGLCKDDPPLKPPPPKFQPCTQRGGVRLHGDQCGGTVTPPPGGSGCPSGTTDCHDGSGACCFGSDLCCGGGCCCIIEVGCNCCG
jgi:hypothetical protein